MNQPRVFKKAVWLAAGVLAMSGVWAQGSGVAGSASPSPESGLRAQSPSDSAGASSSLRSGGQETQGSLAAADRNFLMRAGASGMFEVEAARLAANQAQDEGVKLYAAMLADQHASANQELMGLAQSKGLSLPSTLPAAKRRELDRLKRADGAEFDLAFVQDIGVHDHRQDIRLFRDASRQSKDPEVKAWATKTLPTLEQHLSEARALPAARQPRQPASSGAP